jgi:hypothetical protein
MGLTNGKDVEVMRVLEDKSYLARVVLFSFSIILLFGPALVETIHEKIISFQKYSLLSSWLWWCFITPFAASVLFELFRPVINIFKKKKLSDDRYWRDYSVTLGLLFIWITFSHLIDYFLK